MRRFMLTDRCRWGASCSAALVMFVAMAGCGGGGQTGGGLSEEDRIGEVVSFAGTAIGDPEKFESLFVEGAIPPESERPRYDPLMFKATQTDISGDSATVTVRVENGANDELIGEVQWEAVKVGDEWKLKGAPLPKGA